MLQVPEGRLAPASEEYRDYQPTGKTKFSGGGGEDGCGALVQGRARNRTRIVLTDEIK